MTAEGLALMQAYESRKILPKRYSADMTHIALATVAAVDAVVSWKGAPHSGRTDARAGAEEPC